MPPITSSVSPEVVARAVIQRITPVLGRASFRHFVLQTMPSYEMARHHWLIMEALQLLELGVIDRLIVNMPPRHGKSEIVSVRFPGWYLGKHPDHDVIHVSYGSDLSNDFSRRVRALVRDDLTFRSLFPRVELDPERARVNDWRLMNGGGFRSVGTGGGISGHGADLLIIDDPHKEGEITSTVLNQVFEWYTTGARTRLMPGAKIVICMTRWDLRDLVGQVLRVANSDSNADQWAILNLAAEAEDDDPLGRSPGEALWPAWFPLESLRKIRALDEPNYLALFQQDPRAFNVEMFPEENWRRVARAEVPSERAAWCFDLALGEDESSDYTAFARVTYNRATGEIAFGRLFRERLIWPEAKRRIKELLKLYPDDDFVMPKQTYELMAVQELRYEHPEMAGRIKQVSFPAGSDKRSRAQVLSARQAERKVLIEDSDLAGYWIEEHRDFPGEHDDCVDVGSVATHHYGLQNEFHAAIVDQAAKARRKAAQKADQAAVMERISGHAL